MESELADREICDALDRLILREKRWYLRRLLLDPDRFDRIVAENRLRLEEVCRERGIDFERVSQEAREQLVDDMLLAP